MCIHTGAVFRFDRRRGTTNLSVSDDIVVLQHNITVHWYLSYNKRRQHADDIKYGLTPMTKYTRFSITKLTEKV